MRKNRNDLTNKKREIIIYLMKEKWTITDIARLLHISRQQIYNIIKELDKKKEV